MNWLDKVLKRVFKLREDSDGEAVKPFLDHLEDLRWTLIKMIIALVAGMIVSFFFVDQLTDIMVAPLRAIDPEAAANLQVISPTDPFMVSLTMAFYGGIILSFPLLAYFLLGFILPALTRTERKYLFPGIAGTFLLFAVGVFVCYKLILPGTLKFFADYAIKMKATSHWTLKDYFSFVSHLTLAFGLLCELPVVMLILGMIGLVRYDFLRQTRAYAVIIILMITALIAPTPDPVSFISLSMPVLLLYEMCIWLVWLIERRRSRVKPADDF